MNRILILILLIVTANLCEIQAQSLQTKIVKIEVGGKQVKKDYKVSFFSNGRRIEANRTPTGFAVPDELRNEEFLSLQIAFGKYKLQFSEIHISKFDQDWTVGVEKAPFSEEFVTPEEAETIKSVYYINFESVGILSTQVIVKERKDNQESLSFKVDGKDTNSRTPLSSKATRVDKIVVDGKETGENYKVLFQSNEQWIEGKRTSTGFIIPTELKDEEYLNISVIFGKHKLNFSNIHASKFSQDWIIGVDKKPFSENYVKPQEIETLKQIYYIQFLGQNEVTQLVVKERKDADNISNVSTKDKKFLISRNKKNAQVQQVKLDLNVDGKNELVNGLKAWITTAQNYQNLLELKTTQNSLIVGEEIQAFKTFNVKISLNDYELFLTDLNKNHFNANWKIEIKNPNSSQNTAPPGKKLVMSYKIHFNYPDKDGSYIVSEVYEDAPQNQNISTQSPQTKQNSLQKIGLNAYSQNTEPNFAVTISTISKSGEDKTKAKDKFKSGETVRVKVEITNLSDKVINAPQGIGFSRPVLFRNGQLIPYIQTVSDQLSKGEGGIVSGMLSPKPNEPQLEILDLNEFYGSLEPGQYQLLLERRFFKASRSYSNTVTFEINEKDTNFITMKVYEDRPQIQTTSTQSSPIKQSPSAKFTDSLQVSMYIDNKPVETKNIKMEIYVKQIKLTPELNNSEFSTNSLSWLDEDEKNINLKISFGKYALEFFDLSKQAFQGHWKILINNPPFSASADIPDPKAVDYVYAIEFYSGNSVGTVLSKIKYKDNYAKAVETTNEDGKTVLTETKTNDNTAKTPSLSRRIEPIEINGKNPEKNFQPAFFSNRFSGSRGFGNTEYPLVNIKTYNVNNSNTEILKFRENWWTFLYKQTFVEEYPKAQEIEKVRNCGQFLSCNQTTQVFIKDRNFR